ncbi:hypothetical protein [Paenibacillus cremeus]|uniref:Uncharacterized protein n=1 Tax=Paenibacillus cremeus TaxID=2163881 RepID=A0A559KFJ1_9BACL|nr:hypothetical protein [Paenibacillus cremeus]TVY10887.1 hypothetical protein FPZ49_05225 [Paenibacillus cremeus]
MKSKGYDAEFLQALDKQCEQIIEFTLKHHNDHPQQMSLIEGLARVCVMLAETKRQELQYGFIKVFDPQYYIELKMAEIMRKLEV